MSTFWEGTGGALIGAATSALVAVVAIIRTRKDERELMREQMSLTAAHELVVMAFELRRRVDPFIVKHRPDTPVDWAAVATWAADAEGEAERAYAYSSVVRPQRIHHLLLSLWEELEDLHERLTPEMIQRRDRSTLDDVARATGQVLTNLIDELQEYLRADLERREIDRLPIRRRFRFTARPPFLRRIRAIDLPLDGWGLPKADY